jgi:hypothetical protein
MPDTFLVSLTFASGSDETAEDVEQALRDFVSGQQWQIVALTVLPAD